MVGRAATSSEQSQVIAEPKSAGLYFMNVEMGGKDQGAWYQVKCRTDGPLPHWWEYILWGIGYGKTNRWKTTGKTDGDFDDVEYNNNDEF